MKDQAANNQDNERFKQRPSTKSVALALMSNKLNCMAQKLKFLTLFNIYVLSRILFSKCMLLL